MMQWTYIIAPIFGFLVAGSLKFAINTIKGRHLAFDRIGLGGLPSTHTTIVSTVACLVGLKQGFASASFAIILAVTVIVMIDALDLRNKVGLHASLLKKLLSNSPEASTIREQVGHTLIEVIAGLLVGTACGVFLYFI